MRQLKSFIFFFLVFVSATASACVADGANSFYERIVRSLAVSSATPVIYYVRFQGSLEQLNELLAAGMAGSTTGGREPVYVSLTSARNVPGASASYILGLNKANQTIESVHDARNGSPLRVFYAKGGCHPTVQ
jgi:outer membrane lipoprotein-sorting protein